MKSRPFKLKNPQHWQIRDTEIELRQIVQCELFDWHYIGRIIGGDFVRFCGLLRIYEL